MKSITRTLISILKTIAMPVLIFLAMLIAFPRNVSINTFLNIMYQAIAPTVLALGMLFNIKVNNWDFSVGASAMLSAIFGAQFAMMLNLGAVGMIVLCALVGLACGAINGALYSILKIPTIIVTIGTCLIYEGICTIVFGGNGVMVTQNFIVLNSFLPQVLFGLLALLVAFALYNYLPVGYHIRAIGSSAAIAGSKGISAMKTKISALMIAGLFAGIYAAITVGSTGVYRPATNSMGTLNTCFDAMMCVFVGMCIERYANLVVSVYVGAIVLKYLKLFLMLIGTQSAYDQIIVAMFVMAFLCYATVTDNKHLEKIFKFRKLNKITG